MSEIERYLQENYPSQKVEFPSPYSRHSSWWAIVKRDGFPDVLAEKEDNNSASTFSPIPNPNNNYVYGATPGGNGLELFYDGEDYLSSDDALGLAACLLAAREEMKSFK